ncbi:MAG: hypothetical protein ACREIF_11450 [Chthoniobacterales bacterium]
MSTFARTFCIKRINDQVLEENPWFKHMLLYWQPAGGALRREMPQATELLTEGPPHEEDPERLRLAIRNDYLNLYRSGQSVAKIGFGRSGELQARIHDKYIHGDKGVGQTYVTLTSAGLHDQETGRLREYGGVADLHGWVANANKHVGKEKRFVDLVVARNPDTIDLEMALPPFSPPGQKRTAPRMDLVALEPDGDRWRIVFWEAKLVDDSRARCQGDGQPEVVNQLERYTLWLDHEKHRELVASAYQNACRLLVEFHKIAKRINPRIENLGESIIAVGTPDALPLCIDDKPRLLIDDRAADVAFRENGHLKKLRDIGIHVQMVSGFGDMALETRA